MTVSDDVIWDCINFYSNSHRIKAKTGEHFCRDPYNVTGLCTRQSCPLANAKYATVRNFNGKLYLCIKTPERAHTPNRLWQRIKLSKNYNKLLKQIDENLIYWKKFMIHKCKQRFTRLTQVLMMERRLALKEEERHYVGVKHKVKRREQTRERKALALAKIEKAIEKELLDRMKSGAYGDQPLNIDEKVWKRVLGKMDEEEEEEEEEVEQEIENEEEFDDEVAEYTSDEEEEESDYEGLENLEEVERWLGSDSSDDDDEEEDSESDSEVKKPIKKRKVNMEVEFEDEELQKKVSV